MSNYRAQLERAEQSDKVVPYLLLCRGPMPEPCSVHGKNENLVLPVSHPYWRSTDMRLAPDCKCHVRGVTKREFEELKANGTLSADSPPILNEQGLPTGHKEKLYVPIKTSVSE